MGNENTIILSKSQLKRRKRKRKMKFINLVNSGKIPYSGEKMPQFLSQEEIDNLLSIAEQTELKVSDKPTESQKKFRETLETLFGFGPGEVEDLNNQIDIDEYFKDNNLDKNTFWFGNVSPEGCNSYSEEKKVRLSNIDIEFMFQNVNEKNKEFMKGISFEALVNSKTPEELILLLAEKNRTNQLSLYIHLYEGEKITNFDFKELLRDLKLEEALVTFFIEKYKFNADDLIILLNKALYIKYSLNKKLEYIGLNINTNVLKRLQDLSGAKNDCRKSNAN